VHGIHRVDLDDQKSAPDYYHAADFSVLCAPPARRMPRPSNDRKSFATADRGDRPISFAFHGQGTSRRYMCSNALIGPAPLRSLPGRF
jgi:hypothetical protein